MVPDPPLSIARDHAESMCVMPYGEDDGQAKQVRSNRLLLNFQLNRLFYLVVITCRYVPLLQELLADMSSWIDPFPYLNKTTASVLILFVNPRLHFDGCYAYWSIQNF